jgi:hypothetical protein
MPTDDKLAKLLEKNIEASNRTTHAVRALVRFLFIQLAFLTAAFVLWQIGLAFPDENNCTAFGCEPNGFVSILVLALIIAGVVLSSKAGWDELELSNVFSRHAVPYDTYDSQDDGGTGYSYWDCGKCKSSFELKEVANGACPTCKIPMRRVWEQ